jgi:hypothetical protein
MVFGKSLVTAEKSTSLTLCCTVASWFRCLSYDGLLEYEGVVHAREMSNTARYPVSDCEFVLHLRCGRLD